MKINFLISVCTALIIGLDYGTHSIKLHTILPGGHLTPILTRTSKRKTLNLVHIGSTLFPTFDGEAEGKGNKDAECLVRGDLLKNGLGCSDVSSVSDKRIVAINDTLGLRIKDSVYTLDEICLNLLTHLRKQAETLKAPITSTIITVPSFYTPAQRRSLMTLSEVAGFNNVQIINDATAVAMTFMSGKAFPKKEIHLFYDMGASRSTVTVVSFLSMMQSGRKTVKVDVLGYDTLYEISGNEVDLRVREFLVKEFESKHGVGIRDDERSMNRLLKEANRCKTILSANKVVSASLENLFGFDFRASIKRSVLEGLCKDMIVQVTGPIKAALKNSNMTLEDIKSVVYFGGNVRIPSFQKEIENMVGKDRIARNVDGDEGGTVGAVLFGVGESAVFRLGQIGKVSDLSDSFVTLRTGDQAEVTAFERYSSLGSSKTLDIELSSDVELVANGVVFGSIRGLSGKGLGRITLSLDSSSLIQVTDVSSVSKENLLNKIEFSVEWKGELSDVRKKELKAKLNILELKERQKEAKDTSVNSLETYLYKAKDVLDEDFITEITSEKERDEMRALVQTRKEWFEEVDQDVDAAKFDEIRKEVESSVGKVFGRRREDLERGPLVASIKEKVDSLKAVLNGSLVVTKAIAKSESLLLDFEKRTIDLRRFENGGWNKELKGLDHDVALVLKGVEKEKEKVSREWLDRLKKEKISNEELKRMVDEMVKANKVPIEKEMPMEKEKEMPMEKEKEKAMEKEKEKEKDEHEEL